MLRLSLALVALAAPCVPRERRHAWRRQWDADLRHQGAFLADQRGGIVGAVDLLRRAAGAGPHAVVLRFRSWSLPMFLSDVRYGARMLFRRPVFSLVAILLLGFGIGANATIFSWVDHFVVRPLPGVVRAGEIVAVRGTTPTRRDLSYSYPNFADTRERLPASLAGLVAVRTVALTVRPPGSDPERAWGELVSADFFSVLGVPAQRGRVLIPADDRAPGASAVVVLSHRYWQRRFAADPGIIGGTLAINGRPFTVVGVAGPAFRGATPAMSVDLWVPMMMQGAVTPGDRLTQRGNAWLGVLGRLAPGATLADAQAGLSQVAAGLAREHPDLNGDRGVIAYPLRRDPQSSTSILAPVMGVLLVVVGLVLVIVCANLASLLLARAASRQREIAVRLALGAGRRRIVRQLVTENVLLALAGGAVGCLMALWTSQLMGQFVPPTPLPLSTEVPLNLSLPLVSFGLACATVLFFGLLPALQASRPGLQPLLKDARLVVGSRRPWLRNSLVVVQVATSIVLLVGAGLFIRTLQRATDADVGFDLEQGVLASLELLAGSYDQDKGVQLYRRVVREVEAVPGVMSAALAQDVPLKLGGGSDTQVRVEGYVPAENEELTIYYDRVSPGLFETLGLPLRAGRTFTPADDEAADRVVVINETMARRYWQDGDAVGGRVFLGEWATVVGIVGDAKYTTLTAPPVSYMYLPLYAYYRPDVTLVVRTAIDPGAVMSPIREAVKRLDSSLPLFDMRTVEEHKQIAVFIPRMAATLLGLFGTLALVLATVGLYGLLAFDVGQRTPEIGVRLALGAQRRDIGRLVLGQGLRLTAIGAGLGVAIALAVLPLVSSQLVGVGAGDGLSYAGTMVLLLIGVVSASYLPARRAASVDPVRALRHE
jgi:predicted permease